jgi:hypothetical protein
MAMIDPQHIHDEMDRAYVTFAQLTRNASRSALNAPSDGTRWTNQQLLFHMMFGYLIVRRLLPIVRFFDRLPDRASRSFAAVLNAATRPFHLVNYLGSCAGGTVLSLARTEKLLKRTIEALHLELGKEDESNLCRAMHFPVGWDPYFKDTRLWATSTTTEHSTSTITARNSRSPSWSGRKARRETTLTTGAVTPQDRAAAGTASR